MSILQHLRNLTAGLSESLHAVREAGVSLQDMNTWEQTVRERFVPEEVVQGELPWVTITRALQNSSNPIDRRLLFLGFEATTRALVSLPIQTLWGHAYISGASDAGKTSRTLLPLALQLVACRDLDPTKGPLHRGPILIIDLKGEPYFFHALRKAAAEAGRPFRFFTNHPRRLTHGFNPVLDFHALGLVRGELRDHVRLGMNLEHGAEYGAEHFGALNRQEFDELLEAHPDAESFAELATFLPGPSDPGRTKAWEAQRREHNVSLRMAVKDLAHVPGLNLRPRDNPTAFAESIQMARAFADDEVIYFFLRQRPQETVSRIIGALAIECFYAASRSFNQDDRPPGSLAKHGYVFVDEFQNIAGRNFDGFMETARSSGLSLLLASQSLEKLERLGIGHAIEHSTSFRQFYSARAPSSLRYLRDISGETQLVRDEAPPDGMVELRDGPRFSANDLNALDAEPGFSLVKMGNRDRAQYGGATVAVYMPHTMSYEEFQTLNEGTGWPDSGPALISNLESTLTADPASPSGGTALSATVLPTGAPTPADAPGAIASTPPADTPLARAFAAINITRTGYPPAEDQS
jgi:hypothetical protein